MHTKSLVNKKVLKIKNNVPPRPSTSKSPRDVSKVKKIRMNRIVDELVDKRISLNHRGDGTEMNKMICMNGYWSTTNATRLGCKKNHDKTFISLDVLNIFDNEENLPYLFGESIIIDDEFIDNEFNDDLAGLAFLDD